MTLRLRISTIAELDLEGIHDAICEYNEAAAKRIISQIKSACLLLVGQPFVGAAFGEDYPGLRFRVAGKYVIYYRVLDDAIWIQRVIHGARDARRLL